MNFRGDSRINEGERDGWGEWGGGSVWESCSSFSCFENGDNHRVNFMNECQRRQ